MKSNNTLRVIYSSDDNYAQHLGASVYSLLDCNRDFEKTEVYIIENNISDENKKKLAGVAEGFVNASVDFISFDKWRDSLTLDMPWHISVSSYARLFVSDMLDDSIDRILYLDCDMIVTSSLKELWETDLSGNIVCAVQDAVPDSIKSAVGLESRDKYFNAGMLLIDLEKWRSENIQEKITDFLNEKNGRVIHHDQGVLNGVLKGKVRFVPLKYDLMTVHYILDLAHINKYFANHAQFYGEEEIETAKKEPAILHYTPSFTCRPWVKGCKHPLKDLYWQALSNTPWKGAKEEKNTAKLKSRLVDFRYRNFPF